MVLSRRAYLEQTQSEVRSEFLNKLAKGQVRKGVVSSIVNFGAFVDLGGVDGLVHVSELSWKHIDHPSEVVEVGQEVEVEVLDVDLDRERVSLSLKATQEDPWRQFARTHAIQQIVPGKVTKLVPFGAFVRVDDGIEGLVHISELAERHVEIPEQVVQVGSDVMVKVIDIDLERRRISLSLKQANEGFVEGEEHFDPTLYGMAATYDTEGNYVYPDGFDPETGEWLEGFDKQREVWEKQYADARDALGGPHQAGADRPRRGRRGAGRAGEQRDVVLVEFVESSSTSTRARPRSRRALSPPTRRSPRSRRSWPAARAESTSSTLRAGRAVERGRRRPRSGAAESGTLCPMLLIGLTGGIGAGKMRGRGPPGRAGRDRHRRRRAGPGGGRARHRRPGRGGGRVRPGRARPRRRAGPAALGRVVFADPARRQALERIIHPRVRARSAEIVAAAPPDAIVVNDVPLLVETGLAATYPLVIVVLAAEEIRVARLVRDRGMTEADARARIAAQATDEQRRAVADIVLVNDGTLDELRAAVDAVWWDDVDLGRTPDRSPYAMGRPAPGSRAMSPVLSLDSRAARDGPRALAAHRVRAPRSSLGEPDGRLRAPGLRT